jgi:hypothetical protein
MLPPLLDSSWSTRTAWIVVFTPSSIGEVEDSAKSAYFDQGIWEKSTLLDREKPAESPNREHWRSGLRIAARAPQKNRQYLPPATFCARQTKPY